MTDAPPLDPLTREQRLVTAGIMAAIALAALDSTVVGTAMPTIIGQLGGLSSYAWVFSVYLLTSTTTVPLYAKLADVRGRKPVFLFGLTLFVLGSLLCGLASSMPMLIAFRALQGLGAGAVQPIAFTIAGDIFSPARRARMQGWFSAVWGVSAIIGPALGGLITSTVGWPWVFLINLPVGIAAGLIIWFTLHERFERRQQRIDWSGAVLLTTGIILLLVAVSEGGDLFGWVSPGMGAMLAAAAVLLGWFVRHARRTPEPLVDLQLLAAPVIRAGLLVGTLAGIVMFGVTTFVPPMIQGVHQGTPFEAGATVAAMSLGWPVASVIAGRLLARLGARPLVVSGTGILVVGALLVTQIGRFDALWFAAIACAITGFGMGLSSTTLLVVIQGAVAWNRRAVATGLVQFSRTIGGSVGVGLMGGILAAFVGASSSAILDPVARAGLDPATLEAGRLALADGLGVIYWVMAISAVAAFFVALRSMPDVRLGHQLAEVPERAPEPGAPALEPQEAGRRSQL